LRDIRHTSKCSWANHRPMKVFFNILATLPGTATVAGPLS
jgi:hypothetical protein